MSAQSLMILIAGPYRSGTGDDPKLMARNLHTLESVALPIYRAGHEILYPIANRLLGRCDAVLRLPGASKGADQDVRLAKERGLQVFESLAEIPGCGPKNEQGGTDWQSQNLTPEDPRL